MRKDIEITLRILAVVFFFACLSSCGRIPPGPGREPISFTIPKTDIVYQALNNQVSIQKESNNLIGFVNADSTGNTSIKLAYRAYKPTFLLEAGGLFFHGNTTESPNLLGGGGPTYFLSNSGIYTYCDSLYDEGFIFSVSGTGYLLESDGGNIELADMKTCKVIKRLVKILNPGALSGLVDSAYPSSSGKSMVFSESYLGPKRDLISIMDFETMTVKEILQGGYNASFSPDDQKIAYVGDDGIYIANVNGTGKKLIVRIDFSGYSDYPDIYANSIEVPYPFWSSDGTSLIYHKCGNEDCQDLSDFSIYKVNVNSGVEQKIIDSGLYPVWTK